MNRDFTLRARNLHLLPWIGDGRGGYRMHVAGAPKPPGCNIMGSVGPGYDLARRAMSQQCANLAALPVCTAGGRVYRVITKPP